MSDENKDKTVHDLKPDKDPKGGFGPEPPESIEKKGIPEGKGSNKPGGGGPSPLPPIPGTN